MDANNSNNNTGSAPPASNVQVYDFVLKTADKNTQIGQSLKYYVAKFPDSKSIEFSKWSKPIKVFSEKTRGKEDIPLIPVAPTTGSKQQRRRQLERFYEKKKELEQKKPVRVWHLEDNNAEHAFEGSVEGGQLANYALFMMEGNEFKVYPIEEWYRFKPKTHYVTLSLEEAENQLRNRKAVVDRWMMKKYHKPDDMSNLTPNEIKIEQLKGNDDDDLFDVDKFSATGRMDRRGLKKPKKIKSEGGSDDEGGMSEEAADERGEEPDFEARKSDDDEQLVPEDKDDENKEEEEQAPKGSKEQKSLSEAGKELRKLIKEREKEEEDYISSDSDYDEESEDETPLPEEEEYPPQNAEIKAETMPSLLKHEPSSSEKRPAPSAPEPAAKKVKQEPVDRASLTPVEEEEVRRALLVGGKLTTKMLVKKFKNRLFDKQQKARFAQMVKKFGTIVEEHGEKYLVLKEEYRGGLKLPK